MGTTSLSTGRACPVLRSPRRRSFSGGQPRVVPDPLERAGLRVLANEEELAVDFLNALTQEQRESMRLSWTKGSSIRRPMSITDEVELARPESSGLSRTTLNPDLRRRFDALVEVHLANFVPAVTEGYRARFFAPDIAATILFASADEATGGPVLTGRALYYRLQSGDLIIEFDNTSEQADHIHVVIRDLATDFGRDALAEHKRAQH